MTVNSLKQEQELHGSLLLHDFFFFLMTFELMGLQRGFAIYMVGAKSRLNCYKDC